MLIKGVGVKNLHDYIKEKYPQNYNQWLNGLPVKSKDIFEKTIFLNEWYSLTDSVLIPSKIGSELFCNGDYDKFLYTTGQYNGVKNLNGVYKIFIKITSIEYILKKTRLIFKTYYNHGSIDVDFGENIEIILYGFDKGEEKWFVNIAGYLDSMYRMVSKKQKQFKVVNSFSETSDNKIIGKILIIEK